MLRTIGSYFNHDHRVCFWYRYQVLHTGQFFAFRYFSCFNQFCLFNWIMSWALSWYCYLYPRGPWRKFSWLPQFFFFEYLPDFGGSKISSISTGRWSLSDNLQSKLNVSGARRSVNIASGYLNKKTLFFVWEGSMIMWVVYLWY